MAITVELVPVVNSTVNACVLPSTISIMRKIADGVYGTESEQAYARSYVEHYEQRAEKKRICRERMNQLIHDRIREYLYNNTQIGDIVTVLSVQSGLDDYGDFQGMASYNERCKYSLNAKRDYTRPKIQKALDSLVEDGFFSTSIENVVGYNNKVRVYTRIANSVI